MLRIWWRIRIGVIALVVLAVAVGSDHVGLADGGVEQRIAAFWQRVDAMQPGDYLSSADLGQWALNVIERDANARLTVADFRASTASMQGALDRAGRAPAAPAPTPGRTSPPILLGLSRLNPAGPGIALPISVSSLGNSYDVSVTVQATVRGAAANQQVKLANMFNPDPKPGMEYLLVSIRLLYIKGPSPDIAYGVSDYDFNVISSQGTQYDNPFCVSPSPSFGTKLYAGGATEGWACFMVQQTDPQPTLAFARNYDGSGGRWWRLGW